MKRSRGLMTVVSTVLLGWIPLSLLAPPASAATSSVSCRSSSHPALAARLDRDIGRALRGRVSTVAVGVDDPGRGLQCWLHSTYHFDSASVVKATILSALLRKAQEQHRYLTRTEAGWLPLLTHGWRIHSIGAFTGRGRGYAIVVLTQDNPTMAYGIGTIEAIAKAINHDLNPTARSRVPSSEFSPSWGTPDEAIPAAAGIGGA